MNSHINNLNASDMFDLWVINYSAVKPVTVKMIIIYDSDYMNMYHPQVNTSSSQFYFWFTEA